MNIQSPNDPWSLFWSLGYRRLVPIVPPGAPLAPLSGINPTTLGKVPGVRTEDGWTGLKGWLTRETTHEDTERWRDMGCGIGVLCGGGLLAIDADTLDEEHAAIVASAVEARIGPAPTRIGQPPKALFLVRCPIGWRQPKILFDGGQVDFRTYGQFVAWGVHPKTLQPYRWTRGPLPFDELSEASVEALGALIEDLLRLLPNAKAGRAINEAGPPPDQKMLQGDLKWTALAVAALPNDYPDRADYLTVLYAIKAATAPHSELGWPLALEWALRWNGGENDEETVRRDYDSLRGPYRVGATWLQETAEARSHEPAHKGPTFSRAAMWNDPDASSLFGEPKPDEPPPDLSIVSASSLAGIEPPAQAWLARDLIPARNVTLLSGDGGAGKSLLALQLAASVAAGCNWLGMPVAHGRALFLTAEDEIEELHRRLVAITRGTQAFKLSNLSGLRLISLDGQDAVIAAPSGKDGLLKPTQMMARVRRAVDLVRPALVVLDTLADLFGGDEIKRVHARQFVGMLKGLCNDFSTTTLLLAHPSLSGMASGSGTSGNTAWNNSVRSRLYLERRFGKTEQDEADPDVRLLTTKKANRSRRGVRYVLRWSEGRFVREGVEVESREDDQNRADEETFLRALKQIEDSGRNASHMIAASNYAPKLLEGNTLAGGVGRARLAEAMERLFVRGAIAAEAFGPPSKIRHKLIITKRIDAKEDDSDDLFG